MKPVTVTQVNEYIAKKLREDYNLRNLPMIGEVSSLSRSGGHLYLTLKDQDSQIRCAVWKSFREHIDESLLENGNQVIVLGDISPYARGGSYSFSIKQVEAAGMGDLMKEYNRVKALLQKEGLFDAKYKKPLPAFPRRVGIITSSTGAAVEDIKKIITQKNDVTDLLIFPTLVQGIGAPDSICQNIALANRVNSPDKPIDVLIVGRGGGSPEDLAAFNDEGVARAIFESKIPVISAVGHESDVSISDFVADVRAETPTAAADLAVPDTFALRQEIVDSRVALQQAIRYQFSNQKQMLESMKQLLLSGMRSTIRETRLTIEKAVITLRENDPKNVFSKGYAAVLGEDGKTVSDIDEITQGGTYTVLLRNGSFTASVLDKEKNDE